MDFENLLSLAEAAKKIPNRPSNSAIWRWCRKGLRSRSGQLIRLKHVRVGGRIYTSEPYVTDFFHAVAEADIAYFSSSIEFSKSKTISNRKEVNDRVRIANEICQNAGI